MDKDGKIIAGCDAYVYAWGGCYVDDMWVDEKYRRHELGSHALQAVEKAVEKRGCHIIWLGTWDFQARPYYEKHGYQVLPLFMIVLKDIWTIIYSSLLIKTSQKDS